MHAPSRRTAVRLETVADLDLAELESLIEGTTIQRDRELAAGSVARSDFFDELRAGLKAERERRSTVLTAIDAAMDWYDRRFPEE